MRIFCICVVRDEADIIEQTIEAAAGWSDKILVLDNGSEDGSWDVLQRLEREIPSVSLVGQWLGPFSEELRAEVFAAYRSQAEAGDWWCRLDADEIYEDNPREFLLQVPPSAGFVWSATFNFYFTDRDLSAYQRDPKAWVGKPVSERLRHYQNNWSEGRFVRHHGKLRWRGHVWPPNRGRVHRTRIRLRHYQYRSPDQIVRRLDLRQRRPDIFPHEAGRPLAVPASQNRHWVTEWMQQVDSEEATWQDRIRPASECDFDNGEADLILREDLMPPLPSRPVDIARASLQSSRIGEALIAPAVAMKRRRANPIAR